MTSPGIIWILAGMAAAAAEMIHPGIFLLWIGIAACGTGVVALIAGPAFGGQVLVFVVLLAASLGLALLRLRGRWRASDAVNDPLGDLLGRTCEAVQFAGGEGRVRFRDGSWAARTLDGSDPVAAERLRVVGLDGTTLMVERSEDGAG